VQEQADPADNTGIWIRDGASPVRVSIVLNDGRELHDVTIFARDEGGNLTRRITADVAIYDGDGRALWRRRARDAQVFRR
jgi:hypothetical protein